MIQPAPDRSATVRRLALAAVMAAALSGCASTATNPRDPFEKFNRAMFSFNDTLDQVALKPAATAYKTVLPSFVQTGIGNFFGNLNDVWSGVNNLLQGKGQDGLNDFTRFALNSTFGLVGVLDIATPAGLRKHSEDFGQTLGAWGFGSGPYLMLPLFGASTVRDTLAMPLDTMGDLWHYERPVSNRNIGTAVSVVDQRAVLLDASNLMEEAALDRYEFVRDSYMQRRQSKIDDGGDKLHKVRFFKNPEEKADDKPLSTSVSSETPAKELTPQAVADTTSGSQPGK
jgi:phospholipid-binding lipoprotein MlaA